MTTPARERIPALDVLRGVAVAGILFANVLVFFGLVFLSPERTAALPTAEADSIVRFVERVLVEGKFYSIFSLLFGIGFGLQLARGGEDVLPRLRRRLRILLAIGAIHAFLIWSGDILMLYALLGFTLPWFTRKPDSELLRWVVILLAVPTVLYAVALAVWMLAGPAGAASAAAMPAGIMVIFEAMGAGGIKDAFIGNLIMVAGRWADLFFTMRFPKVLGMFVLGLWAVRAGLATAPAKHRPLLVRWALLGWAIGLPANLVGAWAAHHTSYLPPSAGALLGVAMQAVGFPMLALGYAATIGLLVVDRRRLMGMFAPLGRMALTNYLMQSVICVVLSYGFGFGLWWRTGASTAVAIAAAIVLIQIPLSAWWLSRYRFGPVEWVWRRLTYGRPL
jgi:uncharacterized protein